MRILSLLLCSICCQASVYAQLVQWNFENITEAIAPLPIPASYLDPSIAYGQIGIVGGNNNGTPTYCFGENSWATNFWTIAVTAQENYYMEFRMSPNPGYTATITGFSMFVSSSSIYSANKFDTYVSTDNYATRTYVGTGEIVGEPCVGFYAVFPNNFTIAYGEELIIRAHPYRQFSRFQAATIRIDNVSIEGTALPVRLQSFTSHETTEGICLTWETLTEEHSDYFDIERRLDGTDFQKIGRIKAAGNSHTPRKYTFTDPSAHPGRNYYRLKQSDLNGNYVYYDAIEAKVSPRDNKNRRFSLASNIGSSVFIIRFFKETPHPGNILVFEISTGKLVHRVPIPAGTRNQSLLLDHLSPGIYWIYDTEGRCGEKLVITGTS